MQLRITYHKTEREQLAIDLMLNDGYQIGFIADQRRFCSTIWMRYMVKAAEMESLV